MNLNFDKWIKAHENCTVIPRSQITASDGLEDVVTEACKIAPKEHRGDICLIFNGVPVYIHSEEQGSIKGNFTEFEREIAMAMVMKRYRAGLALLHAFPSDKFD